MVRTAPDSIRTDVQSRWIWFWFLIPPIHGQKAYSELS